VDKVPFPFFRPHPQPRTPVSICVCRSRRVHSFQKLKDLT
jgi:hypothetical protein